MSGRLHGRAADAAVAAAAALVMTVAAVPLWVRAAPQPWRIAVDLVLILGVCATLAFARRRPVPAGGCALVGMFAYYLVSSIDGPLMVVFMAALYAVAAAGRFWAAVLYATLCALGVTVGTLAGNNEINGIAIFMMVGWLVALVALGTVWHSRREYFKEAEARADAAERGREEEARRRATEERLRIVREVHDVVGHHISMINVQAGTALHRLGKDPEHGAAALRAIKDASGEILRDLRATLGVLRQTGESVPTAPAGGLDRLPELVGYAELAGLTVTTEIEGEPRALPLEVDLAGYRIMQESITNVTRHAAARRVRVRVHYGATEVRLEIEDDGVGGPAPGDDDGDGDGSGIDGMRERARSLGGELTAGPVAGGFRVSARLPYEKGTA